MFQGPKEGSTTVRGGAIIRGDATIRGLLEIGCATIRGSYN